MSDYSSANTMQRQVRVLAGDRAWSMNLADSAITCNLRCLWVGDNGPPTIEQLPADRVRQKLGQEVDLLIFDAWSGFDPDAFAAVAGTLRGGGLLLLLIPPREQWLQRQDPYLARISAHPEDFGQHFLQRFVELLDRQPDLLWIDQGREQPDLPPIPHPEAASSLQLTRDQALAVDDLLHTARGRGRRPLVLIADRGRGKSTVLGIAAARLLQEGLTRILVTAPRPDMVGTLFEQAHRALPEAENQGFSLRWKLSELHFLPPDELLRSNQQADLLLVDEAAAIPGPLLEALLERYNRIVFATTVHGYEGTGRGFILRFTNTLDRLTPQWRRRLMKMPVRWAEGDGLERFLYRALLLDAEAVTGQQLRPVESASYQCRRLEFDELMADERLLGELYGLLMSAHYQTRPSDLRRLLDDPDLTIWLMSDQGQVVAALLTLREGNIDSELAGQIALGRRRLRGHLIPQTLAAHAGFPEAAGFVYLRIMRIAVHPALQRQGLGLRLMAALTTYAETGGIDFIGSSFGATPALLRFWYRAGLLPVRIGVRREAASGQHSAVMLRALSANAKPLQQQLQHRFDEQLPHLLGDPLKDLEADIAALLFHAASRLPQLNGQDRRDLQAFAEGYRDYASTRLALWRWCCIASARGDSPSLLQPLILKVLQGHGWSKTANLLGLSGRKAVEKTMRAALAGTAS